MKKPGRIVKKIAYTLFLLVASLNVSAQVVNFTGLLDFVVEDAGGGIYSDTPLGTRFEGFINPFTGNGEIANDVTVTSFGCCIAAGGLSVSNNRMLEAEDVEVINSLLGTAFNPGDLVDGIDIEGDIATAGNGRIESGVSYLFPPDTFNDENLDNYPFDPADLLGGIFFILEEDENGDDIYNALGNLFANPQVRETAIFENESSSAVVSLGITNDGEESFTDSASVGDTISIIAIVEPEPVDVGGDILVAVGVQDTDTGAIVLITDTGLVPYTVGIGQPLVPFITINDVPESIHIPIRRDLPVIEDYVGNYNFYVGYIVLGGDDSIFYNLEPAPLTIASSSGGGGDPIGLSGTWDFTFSINNYPASVAGTACEFDPQESEELGTITYDAQSGSYSISGGFFSADGTVTVAGNNFNYVGSFLEDGGTTNRSLTMDFDPPSTLAGLETWTWSSPGEITCSNIQSTVTATKAL